MNILEIIETKKQGQALTARQIEAVVEGFTRSAFPDYQMSAFLMAVWFRGMVDEEIAALTGAMLRSGEQLDTGSLSGPSADKHSTGGVGDKVSLLLAPLAAACGLKVPMLSGRGLGHTGGTLDKLQAIPGYLIHLETARFLELVEQVGCAIIGQSGNIAPADGRIYALRDVTATVDSIPLITASIMSKKLAAGPQTIVIDLKVGSGAFMRDLQQARQLARALVTVGRTYGRRMAVVFSDMGQPLGRFIGHAHEVIEALDALRPGHRLQAPADLVRLTEQLVAEMLVASGLQPDLAGALALIHGAWDGGAAQAKLLEWVTAQAGRLDPDRADFGLQTAPLAREVVAASPGFLAAVDCRQLGLALADLGGGRRRVEDPIDPSCGIEFLPRIGDRLERGDVLARLFCADRSRADLAAGRIERALDFQTDEVPGVEVVLGRLE